MPELPDIVVYIEALEQRILGQTLERVLIAAPFLLRTAVPPIDRAEGRKVIELRRLGKRICVGLEGDFWLVLHLMIAGRLHWKDGADAAAKKASKTTRPGGLASFRFSNGVLSLTEAGTQRRASLHLVEGDSGLARLDPGGLEIFQISVDEFAKALQLENHTLKRSLTDPRVFSGIGNAYSDEILWEAKISPVALTQKLTPDEIGRLFEATKTTLNKWVEILRAEVNTIGKRGGSGQREPEAVSAFPEKVTAFRKGMAVHGKYGGPCPRCGNNVKRIRYASNETNYCPTCQTAGKLLADRALSRLLRADWPRTAEELEGLTRS